MTYNKYMSKSEVKNIGSFFAWLFLARWVVNDDNELGFRIAGINFWYYKWSSPHCTKYTWRDAEKREFGETVKSLLVDQEPKTPPIGDTPYDAACRVCGTHSVGYKDRHCSHCGCVP